MSESHAGYVTPAWGAFSPTELRWRARTANRRIAFVGGARRNSRRCRRMRFSTVSVSVFVIAGVPLWRAFIGMPTLHPQWGGYSYTWRRDLNAIEPSQFGRGYEYEQILLNSPFGSSDPANGKLRPRGRSLAVLTSASHRTRGTARFSYSQGARRRRRFRLFRGGRPLRRGRGSFSRYRHRLFVRDRPARRLQRR